MFKLNLNPFYAPNDSSTTAPIENKELSKEAMIKFMDDDKDDDVKPLKLDDKEDKDDKLDKDDEKKSKKDEIELEEDDDDDKEEDDDLEDVDDLEDLEEISEEKLELMTPVRRKEILAKYPKLFKEFPYLERAYYREQQFTELLPTIDDARTAVDKSNVLDAFEADLLNGNTEKILTGLKRESPEAFNKLIDNYLPTLSKVDNDAFFHVIGNVVKNTISSMVNEAKKSENPALQEAALILNQFVFGTSEFVPPSQLNKGDRKDDKEDKISERERAFVQKQYDTTKSNLNTKVDNVLKATIESNIDPKNSMTGYVKTAAIRDAHEQLNKLMEGDIRLKTIIDKLWESAFKSDFSQGSIDKIRSAYLSRAKTLLPEVIRKARNEALKGLGKRVASDKSDEETDETPTRRNRGSLPVGRSTSSSNSGKSASQKAGEVPRGMKSIDFLMQD